MLKRVSVVLAVLFFITLSCSYCNASVDGEWEVDVAVKINLSAKTLGSDTISDQTTDYFTFDEEGFYSDYLGLSGSWSQVGAKFLVNLDPDEIVSLFEDILMYEYGLEADLTVVKNTFTGKESKGGDMISGKASVMLTGKVYTDDGDVPGKIKMTVKFKSVK